MTTVYKLYVKSSGSTTLQLLQYLYGELDFISMTNLRLQIIKVGNDKKQNEKLAAKGIHRLPAILTDDMTVVQGAQAIKNIFEKNKKMAAKYDAATAPSVQHRSSAPPPNNFQDDPDLANYYADAMDPRKQVESEEDENGFDAAPRDVLARKVSEAQSRRGINKPPLEQPPKRGDAPAPIPEPHDNVRYATTGNPPPSPPVRITEANVDDEFERRLLERGM